jgi:hypothetical protein
MIPITIPATRVVVNSRYGYLSPSGPLNIPITIRPQRYMYIVELAINLTQLAKGDGKLICGKNNMGTNPIEKTSGQLVHPAVQIRVTTRNAAISSRIACADMDAMAIPPIAR